MALNEFEIEFEVGTVIEKGGGGTGDYEDLENKPSINGQTLIGDKSLSDLGISQNNFYVEDGNLILFTI